MQSSSRIPTHLAFTMDGNRRFGRSVYGDALKGHKAGAEVVEDIVRTVVDRYPTTTHLTFYAFSTENWSRSETEVLHLMGLFRFFFRKKVKVLLAEGVRLQFIGRRDRLPEDICADMARIERQSAHNTTITVTVALDYGGRDEIRRAVEKAFLIAEAANAVRVFEECLDTSILPPVDLLIRTGGEQRLSGFLMWSTEYAELFFTDVPWPQFGAQNLHDALGWYATRERTMGGDSPVTAAA